MTIVRDHMNSEVATESHNSEMSPLQRQAVGVSASFSDFVNISGHVGEREESKRRGSGMITVISLCL